MHILQILRVLIVSPGMGPEPKMVLVFLGILVKVLISCLQCFPRTSESAVRMCSVPWINRALVGRVFGLAPMMAAAVAYPVIILLRWSAAHVHTGRGLATIGNARVGGDLE